MNRIMLICMSLSIILVSCKDVLDPPITSGAGASADHFLKSENFEAIAFEIVYVQGFKPESQTLSNFTSWLRGLVHKPAGISVSYKAITAPAGVSTYTIDKLIEVEEAHRTTNFDGKTMPLYVFFANEGYAADDQQTKYLGVAYRNTSFAIFEKTIEDLSGGLTQPSRAKLETTVMEHEMGHLLGLVDLTTPMQTTHRANGNHCDDPDCLMYYATETDGVVANLLGSPVPTLDQNCHQDLEAAGGQ